jgi:hypothetical protein
MGIEVETGQPLYHRFLEPIVARVPITTLLQRGYSVNQIVLVGDYET